MSLQPSRAAIGLSASLLAVLQLSFTPGPLGGPALELQNQIRDYSQLISDPVCPEEMRDLLVMELGQIITALLLYCEQLTCVLAGEECMIAPQQDAAQ